MIIEVIVIYLISGIFIGILSGLFGAGGGIVAVPALLFIFTLQGFPESSVMPCVIGTSLGIMIFTSLSSIYSHHQLGNINWPVAKILVPWIAISVIIGSSFANFLPSYMIQIIFAAFVIFAIYKVLNKAKMTRLEQQETVQIPRKYKLVSLGMITGIFSAIIGIGGSIITVPVMRGWQFPMRNAIATAVVCGFPIALFGTISYTIMGLIYPVILPLGSIGNVNWLAVPCMALPSMICARFGSKLATIIPDNWLRYSYLILLVVITIDMLYHIFI